MVHPRTRRLASLLVAVIAGVVLVSCAPGVKAGSESADPFGGSTKTTGQRSTDTPATTEPAKVPAGWKTVSEDGIGLTFAVPKAWQIKAITASDLLERRDEIERANPKLKGALEAAQAVMGDSKVLVGAGPGSALSAPNVNVIQLEMSLPSVSDVMAEMFTTQLESVGATEVSAHTVDVAGLEPNAKALRVDAYVPNGTRTVRVHLLVVPTSEGIAELSLRAPDALAEQIIATINAG